MLRRLYARDIPTADLSAAKQTGADELLEQLEHFGAPPPPLIVPYLRNSCPGVKLRVSV
jgi:hypothetical protein